MWGMRCDVGCETGRGWDVREDVGVRQDVGCEAELRCEAGHRAGDRTWTGCETTPGV